MKLLDNRVFRRLLMSFTYAFGAFLIVASGGSGSGSSDDSCRLVVSAIARATGTDDIWVGVLSELPSGEFNSVARLDRDGLETFPPVPLASGFENVIRTVAVVAVAGGGSQVYVGGDFSEGIFRLNADGLLDNAFDVGSGFNDSVSTIVPVADGSGEIYVGGFFTEYDGSPVGGLVRLNPDGSLDVNYVGSQEIQAVAMVGAPPAYPLYSGGSFAPTLARWSSFGFRDLDYKPSVRSDPVFSVALVEGEPGAVYAGGDFSGGIYRFNIVGGAPDNTFDVGTGFNDSVRKIVHTKDAPPSIYEGDIYAVGEFTTYQGSAANGLVRLKDDGSREPSFMTGTGFSNSDGLVPFGQFATSLLAADASGDLYVNGDLYVGGDFTDYNGTAADGIVRLDNSGMLDPDFDAKISSESGTCTDGTFVEDV
jgi:hypothetical protein